MLTKYLSRLTIYSWSFIVLGACATLPPSEKFENPLGGVWVLKSISCPTSKGLEDLEAANSQLKKNPMASAFLVYKNKARFEDTRYGSNNGLPSVCKTIANSTWIVSETEITVSDTVQRGISDNDPSCPLEFKEAGARSHKYKRQGNRLSLIIQPRPSQGKSTKLCEDDTVEHHYERYR